MDIGIIGLGKMGRNMARRLIQGSHRVVGLDSSDEVTRQAAAEFGLDPVFSFTDLAAALPAPRAVWTMVPAGEPTEMVIRELSAVLQPGDLIVDGGNTYYKDDIRRAEMLQTSGIHHVDVGTSGGVWGLTEGYSLMAGGDAEDVEKVRPILESLAPAPDQGWGRVGPHGAGHFVKMVHNGIEYGLMQAYAEGFEILHAKKDFDLDVEKIARIWQTGSVVRSWLLDLIARALESDPDLESIRGWVADSGEGRWTVFESIDLDVPAPVITLSLQQRFSSRQEESYAAKLLAAMRNQFGGHAVKTKE
ncbi:6-phosphogluconate dehydrogenase [Longilinea arvoryzae]|uniref:6-phosphogluconate dehydrogenase n=1 Tax=Longilinea arvoryzae TaxID=360412 RepID=A0A0S7BJD8_9CHLR|nr:decarboxylating 6-phosphogluconate dehydrogenase [Longilinea arvoryzae]GAP13909.1 6-phosphogluconate dehydrogenase [Longilinea arvoryzae]